DDVGLEGATQQLYVDLGGVADHGDRCRRLRLAGGFGPGDRLIELCRRLVEVACFQPALDPRRIHLDAESDALVHGHCQRLRAAHTTVSTGEDDSDAQADV